MNEQETKQAEAIEAVQQAMPKAMWALLSTLSPEDVNKQLRIAEGQRAELKKRLQLVARLIERAIDRLNDLTDEQVATALAASDQAVQPENDRAQWRNQWREKWNKQMMEQNEQAQAAQMIQKQVLTELVNRMTAKLQAANSNKQQQGSTTEAQQQPQTT